MYNILSLDSELSPGFSTTSGAAQGMGKYANGKCHNILEYRLKDTSHMQVSNSTGQWSPLVKVHGFW